ncbi:ATP-binding protein [Novosphingobium panipatense]|uniref:ATP-binding protein n=1 Tax=Novosphingobium panipatense TaxID=428991 RepID=UPI00361C3ED6
MSAQAATAGPNSGLVAGEYVCLSVADEGSGMDEETLAKASEPFFTTKGIGKGTGLGLSMVVGMAGQFGGKTELKSKAGRAPPSPSGFRWRVTSHRERLHPRQAMSPRRGVSGR